MTRLPSRFYLAAWRAVTTGLLLLTLAIAMRRSQHPEILGRYSMTAFVALLTAAATTGALITARRTGLLQALYTARRPLAMVALSTLVGLAALEAAVRVADPLGLSYYEESKRYHLEKEADPVLVYRHRRSYTSDYQGVEVRLNELGLRDKALGPKLPGEYRVLFLGDSVVFGWGVTQEQTVSYRLEGLLRDELDRPVRVINAGVGSYNTLQEWRFLSKSGFELDPDIVLLLYVSNDAGVQTEPFDPWAEQSLRGKSLPQAAMLLLGHSWLFRLGVFAASPNSASATPRGSSGWLASMEALAQMQRACAERGLPFVPMYFRWQSDPADTLFSDVRKALHPLSVRDAATWFAGLPIPQYVNSTVDSHPNERGHDVMARSIVKILLALSQGGAS